jgi:RNA polymerase sigma factor (sigma-70 family)
MAHRSLGGVLEFLRRALGAPPADALSDRQLLHRFAQHADSDAFAALVRRHGPMVLAVCQRVLGDGADAEDAFQAAFIVLARKAGSLGWHESIGGWLHEVAFRTASKARVAVAQRRRHESQVRSMPEAKTLDEASRRELRTILDEELSQLPEKYRAPLVLCYLEGKTNDEAAQLLGWPIGTVSGRLARARDMLRVRLERRRLVLPATVLAAALADSVAPAAVSTHLFDATVAAVTLPAPGVLAAPIATLVEGVLHTMFVTKLKIAGVIVLTVGLVAGTGLFLRNSGRSAAVANANPVPAPNTETTVDKEPTASEPVVKDGLSITVKPDKKVFEEEKPISFTVTFKNLSKQPFLLFDVDYSWSCEVFIYQHSVVDGWAVGFPTNRGLRRAPIPDDSLPLQAGESRTVRVVLSNAVSYVWRGQQTIANPWRRYLAQGKYHVTVGRLFAENPAKGEYKYRHWTGAITSKPVDIEIDEAIVGEDRARSKPVRVNGADFEVTTEKVWHMPPAAGKMQPIDIRLRIVNRGTTEVTFNLFDTITPILKTPDGKEHELHSVRKGTGPAQPIRVAPGKSVNVAYSGTLDLLNDGKTARLSGGDLSGGMWSFDGIKPGKYTLRLAYANQTPGSSYWLGTVKTEPVAFDVATLK